MAFREGQVYRCPEPSCGVRGHRHQGRSARLLRRPKSHLLPRPRHGANHGRLKNTNPSRNRVLAAIADGVAAGSLGMPYVDLEQAAPDKQFVSRFPVRLLVRHNVLPLFHVAGSFVYGLSVLLAGGELVLPTALGMRNAQFVRRYWQFVERHRVSLLGAVPTVMAGLLNVERGDARLDRVRMLLTGGSPLPVELAGAFEKQHGIPVRNILGMTECAGVISIEPFHAPRTPGACGCPCRSRRSRPFRT